MNTHRIQLSYTLDGFRESYPVEVKAFNPVTAAVIVANSALSLFKGVTNIRVQLLS